MFCELDRCQISVLWYFKLIVKGDGKVVIYIAHNLDAPLRQHRFSQTVRLNHFQMSTFSIFLIVFEFRISQFRYRVFILEVDYFTIMPDKLDIEKLLYFQISDGDRTIS